MNSNEIKAQICDVCHKMWQLGWVAANDGNVSVKMDDGSYWITPSGISKAFITEDKLIRVDEDMNVLANPVDYDTRDSLHPSVQRTGALHLIHFKLH